jgi:hypothetical protein
MKLRLERILIPRIREALVAAVAAIHSNASTAFPPASFGPAVLPAAAMRAGMPAVSAFVAVILGSLRTFHREIIRHRLGYGCKVCRWIEGTAPACLAYESGSAERWTDGRGPNPGQDRNCRSLIHRGPDSLRRHRAGQPPGRCPRLLLRGGTATTLADGTAHQVAAAATALVETQTHEANQSRRPAVTHGINPNTTAMWTGTNHALWANYN